MWAILPERIPDGQVSGNFLLRSSKNIDKKGLLLDHIDEVFIKGKAKDLIDGGEKPDECGSRYSV
jgi:hypothetical protein